MLQEAAAAISSQADALVPVATGDLKGSGYHRLNSPTESEAGFTAEHAVYVEFGTGDMGAGGGRKWVYYNAKLGQFVTTSGMAPQPFLRPALDFVRKRLVRLWRQAR
jgi:hypothetical protein